jgi:hypothetical protein
MTDPKSEIVSGTSETIEEKKGIAIDLEEMYKIDPKKVASDITHCRYSNLAYIQVTERDVFIDFLEMPGVKKDDRQVVNGTRIYMTHVAAQKLSTVLQNILDGVARAKGMEGYELRGKK